MTLSRGSFPCSALTTVNLLQYISSFSTSAVVIPIASHLPSLTAVLSGKSSCFCTLLLGCVQPLVTLPEVQYTFLFSLNIWDCTQLFRIYFLWMGPIYPGIQIALCVFCCCCDLSLHLCFWHLQIELLDGFIFVSRLVIKILPEVRYVCFLCYFVGSVIRHFSVSYSYYIMFIYFSLKAREG